MAKSWIRSLQRSASETGSNGRLSSHRRAKRRGYQPPAACQVEQLESRALLTTLFIEPNNLATFLQPGGGIKIDNAAMAGYDAIAIENIAVSDSDAAGIDIDLTGLSVTSIAIENVTVSDSAGAGIRVHLDDISNFNTLAIDSVNVTASGGPGVDVQIDNMTAGGLAIDSSTIDGIRIRGTNSDLEDGRISRNTLSGGIGVNGILLDLDGSSADEFTIADNASISSATEDSVKFNFNDSPVEALNVLNNRFAPAQAVSVDFLIDGDTFTQPFRLRNTSLPGGNIQRVLMDIEPSGLVFDTDPVTGKPFTPLNNTDLQTGLSSSFATATTLEMNFGAFDPGDLLEWNIDLDIAGTQSPVFGNQLIGSTMTIEFTSGQIIPGVLVAVPGVPDAARFVTAAGGTGGHGINFALDDSPLTKVAVGGNQISGNVEGGILFNANDSSVTDARLFDNLVDATGGDGVRFALVDSDFSGSMTGNSLSGHAGAGIRFTPNVEVSGNVEAATNGAPIRITSTNHGLIGGETIVVQGVEGNLQANGVYEAGFVNADQFTLVGSDGSNLGVDTDIYEGGGTWFVAKAAGNIISATNDDNDIVITTAAPHGLSNPTDGSDLILNVQGIRGNLAANGTHRIEVLTASTFRLIGVKGSGDFDNTHPDFGVVPGAVWWQGYRVDMGFTDGFAFADNVLTSNQEGGVQTDLAQGTAMDARIVRNVFQSNMSFGWRTTTRAGEFSHFFGSDDAADANIFDRNVGSGIALNVLDTGQGSYEIRKNQFLATQDLFGNSVFNGDGVNVRMEGSQGDSEATASLNISVIDGNTFGVDNLGNEGNGVSFHMQERTAIDSLHITNNTFLNNGLDGFKFFRRDDAELNGVFVEKNTFENHGSDGIDFFAQNTTRDLLDFVVNENEITNNDEYGLRIAVAADARIQANLDNNTIDFNGQRANGNGEHPNDNLGNRGTAGGIGLRGFQQVEVLMDLNNNRIRNNFGDGFHTDAPLVIDSMRVSGVWTDNTITNNMLSGFRQDGVAFSNFVWLDNTFENNGEDGARIINGDDIDILGMRNTFVSNFQNGLHLGRAINAVFGDGTIANQNIFDSNGEDGFKVTQSNGAYLANRGRGRYIDLALNRFNLNGDDGIDVGEDPNHFRQTGPGAGTGNVLHGDEEVTNTHVTVTDAIIFRNGGDGVEYLGEGIGFSSLTVRDSRITRNGKRGIDILNAVGENTNVTLIDNTVASNYLSGIYIVNTTSSTQRQDSEKDDLVADGDFTNVIPELELRIRENTIQSNGNADPGTVSTVTLAGQNPLNSNTNVIGLPVTSRQEMNNSVGLASLIPDHTIGTLGGLVIRVGTSDSIGALEASAPSIELTNYATGSTRGGVRAEVVNNAFDGNFGSEVFFDSFTSTIIPPLTQNNWNTSDNPSYQITNLWRDPLSRFDLAFYGNTGNSLDVLNGYAFYDNAESEFKSRGNASRTPSDNHNNDPRGPFGGGNNDIRWRNATRTLGRDIPIVVAPGFFGFEGWGNSSWRVEAGFETSGFQLDDPVFGFSNFFDTERLVSVRHLDNSLSYAWDTGGTSTSLGAGVIFGDIIEADRFEDNDTFLAATDFGFGTSVSESNLTIDTNGDDDFYKFTAADNGNFSISVKSDDTNSLRFRVWEYRPDRLTEETSISGTLFVSAGGTTSFNGVATAGRTYFVQVLGRATTTRRTSTGYTLNITAPADPGATPPPPTTPPTTPPPPTITTVTPTGLNAPIVVNDTGDSVPVLPGDGSAEDASGNITLRSAVIEANLQPGADTIELPAGTFTLSLAGINEDLAQTGDLDIRDEVTIVGAGPNLTFIDADTLDRIFEVLPGHRLELIGVTLLDGNAAFGGAIYNAGQLDLQDSVLGDPTNDLENNRATDQGGALFNEAGLVDSLALDADAEQTTIAVNDGSIFAGIPTPFRIVVEDELMQVTAVNGDLLTVVRGLDGRTRLLAPLGSDLSDGDTIGLVSNNISYVLEFEDQAVLDGVEQGHVLVPFRTTDTATTVARSITSAINGLNALVTATRSGSQVDIVDGVFSPSTTAASHSAGVEVRVLYSGIMNVARSTVFGSFAGSRGGALYNEGTASFLNSTLSTNGAGSRGGGIFNDGALTLTNVTVTENYAGSRAGGVDNNNAATVSIVNTIVAGNMAASRDPDVRGAFNSLGHNIIGEVSEDSGVPNAFGFTSDTDLVGAEGAPVNPLLGPITLGAALAPGTGGTWVHPLLAGSPAIEGGLDSAVPAGVMYDNRLAPRFVDGNHTSLDHVTTVDIGAFEFYVDRPVADFLIMDSPTDPGERVNFDASLTSHTNPLGHADPATFTYRWDLDNDGQFDDATGLTANRVFLTAGTYMVSLEVTDDTNQVVAITKKVEVLDAVDQKTTIIRPFAATTDHTPTIVWEDTGTNYWLWVANLTTGDLQVINQTTLTVNQFTPGSKLPTGRYRAWVQTFNNLGQRSPWSDPYDFEIFDNVLTGPQTGFDITPVFTWTDIPGAVSYDLWVSGVTAGQPQLFRRPNIAGTQDSLESPLDLALGKYRAWIRSTNALGEVGDWSAPLNFEVITSRITAPGTPTMNEQPTISWTAVPNASRYDLEVINLDTGLTQIRSRFLTSTSFTPGSPLPAAKYVARVRPIDATGTAGHFSPDYPFEINPRLRPVMLAPEGTLFNRFPTFRWEAVNGANRYELWVSNLTTGEARAINETDLTGTTFTPTSRLDGGEYRVWVRAFSATTGVSSRWSVPLNFSVAMPIVTAPTSPVTNTRFPRITWTTDPLFTEFEIWIANLTTGDSRIINRKGLKNNAYGLNDYQLDGFADGLMNGTYRVWVQARNAQGQKSVWSPAFDFDVAITTPVPPTLISPSGTTGPFPIFRWDPSPNAVSYELLVKARIGSDTDPQPVVFEVKNITQTQYQHNVALPPGNYRWWVRAVNALGTHPDDYSSYSNPFDFTVVQVDQPQNVPTAASPSDEQPVPVDAPAQPAGQQPVILLSDRNGQPMPLNDATQIEVNGIRLSTLPSHPSDDTPTPAESDPQLDLVMSDWPATDWWSQIDIKGANEDREAAPVVETLQESSESAPVEITARELAMALPLVAGQMARRKRRPDKE